MELKPRDVRGISWQVEEDGPARVRLSGKMFFREVAHATLEFRQRVPGEYQVTLAGGVKPGYQRRGLGSAMLAWAEDVARARRATLGEASLMLVVDTAGASAGEAALFSGCGLELAVAEDEMRRDLRAFDEPLPGGIALEPWTAATASHFYAAYVKAFRDRPGFPNWPEERWQVAFAAGPDFRPDISAVAIDGTDAAGFAILWVDGPTGWITQMGVVPGWRGTGLGEALLAHAIAAFAGEGLREAALDVATNNARARALYERTGFRVVRRYESWRKPIIEPD
jgi:ribosomal protein S18 acetylase RimI-like enzyme